jgi:hypothetical protein
MRSAKVNGPWRDASASLLSNLRSAII